MLESHMGGSVALVRCVWTTGKEKHRDILLQKSLEVVECARTKIDLHHLFRGVI